ncbi:MAG: hypothetical protein EU544_03255 [Promethearchaeota archaeon]|nr:MAG: hypothetical protein EU544_03255 [Candidatus Lokiarchaeota archaeon]
MRIPKEFDWDLDLPLEELAERFKEKFGEPSWEEVLFLHEGNKLPPNKSLRELGLLYPAREIKSVWISQSQIQE